MPGRYTTSNDERYKFTGHERDEFAGDMSLDYMNARNYDPEIGTFLQIDPMADSYPGVSPYNYVLNNPMRYIDPTGQTAECTSGDDCPEWVHKTGIIPECSKEPCYEQRAIQGAVIRQGSAAAKASSVRNTYVEETSKATTSAERTSAKVKARASTPTEYAAVAEAMRPIGEEGSRTGGTVNKTNANVNSKIKIAGKLGRGAVVLSAGVSVYNITTAQDKTRAVTGEAGAWGGALIGGGLGAKGGAAVGAFFGGVGAVPGAFIGGIVGGAAGAIVGEEAANKAYDYLFGD